MRDNRDAIDFANEPVGHIFRQLLVPTVIGMLSVVILNLTDGAFVGHGTGALHYVEHCHRRLLAERRAVAESHVVHSASRLRVHCPFVHCPAETPRRSRHLACHPARRTPDLRCNRLFQRKIPKLDPLTSDISGPPQFPESNSRSGGDVQGIHVVFHRNANDVIGLRDGFL